MLKDMMFIIINACKPWTQEFTFVKYGMNQSQYLIGFVTKIGSLPE